MQPSITERLATYLDLSKECVQRMAKEAPESYRRFRIPKAGGGERLIHQPSQETLCLQHGLMKIALADPPVHDCATAYVSRPGGSPLLRNAKLHARFPYSIRIDLRNFFPSIRPGDLLQRLKQHYGSLAHEDEGLISLALFVRLRGGVMALAVGAPSSPTVSNIVMYTLDSALSACARSRGGVFSRYADDFVFSTDRPGECASFLRHVSEELARTDSPRLCINSKKTRFMSRGNRRIITGIRITPEGGTSVGHAKKREVCKLLHNFRRGRLPADERAYLQGYLAFLLDVERGFCRTLAQKYGPDVLNAALHLHVAPPIAISPSG
jgi:hypothetical protein